MKTKNIFKALAAAMLMPAMLLTASCSSEDNLVNNENTGTAAKQGYTLPVTVNVTRQGDNAATRAAYNESTKKLAFSEGDKLFVSGEDLSTDGAGKFAGTLDYDSETGKFSGTISTKNEYDGTADDLFSKASTDSYIEATLLPDGYGDYDFLSIDDNWTDTDESDDCIYPYYYQAFALTKAAGVEQLSYEYADSYSSGFALTPKNAILNFTIVGLTASTSVNVTFNGTGDISRSVTTDASGTATFAIGVANGTNLSACTLSVGDKAITLGSQSLSAGKIYNITRCIYPIDLNQVKSAAYLGSVVATNGKVYAKTSDVPSGQTAVAMIAYVGSDTDNAEYVHGLAIALADESSSNWSTAKSNCGSKNNSTPVTSATWLLPSQAQWKAMFKAFGGSNSSYSSLNTAITTAGGSGLQEFGGYWSSTEYNNSGNAYDVYLSGGNAVWVDNDKVGGQHVRACLAF